MMRLLNSSNLHFEEFFGNNIPEYAILSHRWEPNNEVPYQDMCIAIRYGNTSDATQIRNRQGFHKIYNSGQQALRDGYQYIWVDTCCIDKSSSAELQEAINSMYRWYENSGVCYAYLCDVSVVDNVGVQLDGGPSKTGRIESSQWFSRGWTLQELLAPRDLVFFDRNWKRCGSASSLCDVIESVTGINLQEVRSVGEGPKFWNFRIARRMSWAASRQTTRIEDQAYSPLGIFDINMPLLYGEGERSFQRLQEEIMKGDDDISLLAWSSTDADTGFASNGLARSPAHFRKYPDLVLGKVTTITHSKSIPKMTPRGLHMRLNIRRDLNEKMVAYAVLANGLYKRSEVSLILPILFPQSAFSKSHADKECIRFSDPLWVPSTFVRKAKLESICFIRQVHGAKLNREGDGLSLCSTVWRDYATNFMYPVQTQCGRRPFPAIMGGFSGRSGRYTFVLELTSRASDRQKFVILVDYRVRDRQIIRENGLKVTVLKLQKNAGLKLNVAASLATFKNHRHRFTSCDLPDRDGNAISMDRIVCIGCFSDYWLRDGDNDVDILPYRRPRYSETRSLGATQRGPVADG